MRKPRRSILLAALVVAIFGGLTWLILPEREPLYHGKPLHFWLEHASSPMTEDDTYDLEAIRQFGPGVVPILLKMARANDSPVKTDWIKLARAQSIIPRHPHTDKEYHRMACSGFYALGPLGKAGVPDLIKLLDSMDEPVRATAKDCLGDIGPDAKAAVPYFVKLLSDTNRIVRWSATVSLGRIHSEPEIAVPALLNQLNVSNSILQTTIMALGEFGPSAKPAFPILWQYVNDTNHDLRLETRNALKKIDSEAAAAAGIK